MQSLNSKVIIITGSESPLLSTSWQPRSDFTGKRTDRTPCFLLVEKPRSDFTGKRTDWTQSLEQRNIKNTHKTMQLLLQSYLSKMRFLRDKQISTLSPIPVSNGTQEIEGWDCNACFGKIVIWLYVPPLVAGDCMVLCVFFMFLCSKDWVRSVRLPVKSDQGCQKKMGSLHYLR